MELEISNVLIGIIGSFERGGFGNMYYKYTKCTKFSIGQMDSDSQCAVLRFEGGFANMFK